MHTFGVPVSDLPEAFQAEVARLNLAQDGVWKTFAETPEDARRQIASIVRIITKQKPPLSTINPVRLSKKVVLHRARKFGRMVGKPKVKPVADMAA